MSVFDSKCEICNIKIEKHELRIFVQTNKFWDHIRVVHLDCVMQKCVI
jgi:hypothetical protein